MGYPSTFEKIEDRRADAQHRGDLPLDALRPGPQTYIKDTQGHRSQALRPSEHFSEKRMLELRQGRTEREQRQLAWRKEMNLIWIHEENVIVDFANRKVAPIDSRRPVSAFWQRYLDIP